MTYFPIQPKIQVYIDSLGDPLDDGYIYFGKANLDPTLYPAKVSWDESGLYPVEFPVRTMNGYPLRNNVPAQMFINQEDNYEFSVLINDEDEVEVFSSTTEGLVGYFPSTGAAGDADTLEGHPASYFAVDSLAAHLAGAETFTGTKTITASFIIGSATANGIRLLQPLNDLQTGIRNPLFYVTDGQIGGIRSGAGNHLIIQGRNDASSGDIIFAVGSSSSTPEETMTVLGATKIVDFLNTPTVGGSDTVYHTGNDSTLAHLAGAETFTGVKTYSAEPVLNNSIYLRGLDTGATSQRLIGVNASDILDLGNTALPTNIRSNGTLQYNGTTLASGTIDTTATQTITVVDGLITSIV